MQQLFVYSQPRGGGSLVVLAIVSSIVLTIGSSDAVHSADPDSKDGCDGEMVLL